MVSIKFKDQTEIMDFSGHTVKEARESFKETLDIPDRARARLNGKTISIKAESSTALNDDDELVFSQASHRGIILIATLFVAVAVTGSVFAVGYINSTQSVNVTLNGGGGNFVDVTTNASKPLNWNLPGGSSGETGNGTMWDINTATSTYTGDLTAVIYLTNIDKMKHVYRGFGISLAVYNSSGALMDINKDGNANINDDLAFLSLNNGVIELYINGGADIFTIVVDHGFFITNPYDAGTWTSDAVGPALYIELMQR
jgi:hypothetical protein